MGKVFAQLLHVRPANLARPAHQLDRHAQIGDAAPLPRQIERPFLAALGHAHVAHAHLVEERGAEVFE